MAGAAICGLMMVGGMGVSRGVDEGEEGEEAAEVDEDEEGEEEEEAAEERDEEGGRTPCTIGTSGN